MPAVQSTTVMTTLLMYHQVGNFPWQKEHRASFCDTGRFRRQLVFLDAFGFQVVSLHEAAERWQRLYTGKPPAADAPLEGGRRVVFAFDDGCQNFADNAWPLLRRHHFSATMYLISNQLGGTLAWCGSKLMDQATVQRLAAEGMNFGSHTRSHCHLSQLSSAEKRKEIFDSKKELEDVLQKPVTDFAYPYGDYDPEATALVKEAGYTTAVSCIRGCLENSYDRFELNRKAISQGDSLIGYAFKLFFKNVRKDNSKYNPPHVRARGN